MTSQVYVTFAADFAGRVHVDGFSNPDPISALQEALRLHHAGNPMYSPCRVCTEDVELGGYVIPQGVGVMLNMVGMAHDDKWFPRHQVLRLTGYILQAKH